MKRTRLENSSCPIARSLDVIGDWWSLLIVRDALGGDPALQRISKAPWHC